MAVLVLAPALALTGSAIRVDAALTPTPSGAITTVAGGPGGPGAARGIGIRPCGVAAGRGRLYVADGLSVRRIVQKTGVMAMAAGTGSGGPAGAGGLATRASVSTCGIAIDQSGNLLIADVDNDLIRAVAAQPGTFYGQKMSGGHIYTVAGDGQQGFAGDRDRATGADLDSPSAVAVDQSGNLVIADAGNERIRVVAVSRGTFYGQKMTAGHIYTVAGNGGFGYSGDQDRATKAQFSDPDDVAVDHAGNLVVADSDNDRVRVVAGRTGRFYGRPMTAGDIYTVAGDGEVGRSGDGGLATKSRLAGPDGVAVDDSGDLVISDARSDRVRVLPGRTGTLYRQPMKAGHLYTVAGDAAAGRSGDGGPAAAAELSNPADLAIDGAGNLVIADTGNNRIQVAAARSGTFYGQAMIAGDIYTIAGRTAAAGSAGDGGPAVAARFSAPFGIAVDATGNVLVADSGNSRVQLVAAAGGKFYGQSMIGGHVYTIAGSGTQGYSGDRGPATAAELTSSFGVAVDHAGNVVIADTGNNVIRVVAARGGRFYGQAMSAGRIYTVAGNGSAGFGGDGGRAATASMRSPFGVAVDHAGNLVIADAGNNRIRVVAARSGAFYGQAMSAGHIYTLAGNGSEGFNGGGGPGQQAELDTPQGVAVDQAGNVLVADTLNSRIRVVAASTGTFYGVAMTVGHIYTIAGNGSRGYSGDGGPAMFAGLHDPGGVSADGAGDVFIADALNSRIREVTGSPAAATFAVATKQVFTNWPSYLYSAAHTSDNRAATAITVANAASQRPLWKFQPAQVPITSLTGFYASPTVYNGIVYIGARNGYFYALNETTGKVAWKRFIGYIPERTCGPEGFTSTATVSAGQGPGHRPTVYVYGATGYLYAMNAATGRNVWPPAKVALPSPTVSDYYAWSSPLVAAGNIYLGIASECDRPLVRAGLAEFSQTSGAHENTFWTTAQGTVGGSIWSSAAFDGRSVYITTGNGGPGSAGFAVIKLSPAMSQRSSWAIPPAQRVNDSDFGGSPGIWDAAIHGKRKEFIGACNKNGIFYAFEAADISAGPVWTLRIGDPSTAGVGICTAAPLFDGTRLYLASNGTKIKGIRYNGSLREVNPATGAIIWQRGLSGPIIGTPGMDGGGVIAAASFGSTTNHNGLWLIDAATGRLLKSFGYAGSNTFGQPVFADKFLFVASTLTGLTAYGRR